MTFTFSFIIIIIIISSSSSSSSSTAAATTTTTLKHCWMIKSQFLGGARTGNRKHSVPFPTPAYL
jgi:hypothetical protein